MYTREFSPYLVLSSIQERILHYPKTETISIAAIREFLNYMWGNTVNMLSINDVSDAVRPYVLVQDERLLTLFNQIPTGDSYDEDLLDKVSDQIPKLIPSLKVSLSPVDPKIVAAIESTWPTYEQRVAQRYGTGVEAQRAMVVGQLFDL